MMDSTFVRHTSCPKCGSRDNLAEYTDHLWCFGCGYHKHLSPGYRHRTSEPVKHEKSLFLPDDIETIIPYQAHTWLQKYQLTTTELLRNNIVWSDSMQLLIFLYTENNVLKAWQGRYFGTDPTKKKWWGQGNLLNLTHLLNKEKAVRSIIIVEDIVSAIKVSRQYSCLPLFGSYIDIIKIYKLYKQYKGNIVIWLDKDKYKESHKYSIKLNQLGVPTKVIHSEKDPKFYSDEEIKHIYESQTTHSQAAA